MQWIAHFRCCRIKEKLSQSNDPASEYADVLSQNDEKHPKTMTWYLKNNEKHSGNNDKTMTQGCMSSFGDTKSIFQDTKSVF